MKPRIDLNCDLGEGAGHDAGLMPLISSANIACGGHAGDAGTMQAAVALALAHGVAIGAHPGLPDREHFGRRELSVTPEDVREWTTQQIRALADVAQAQGVTLAHVKPHGALYNLAARDAVIAGAIARAVAAVDRGLILFGLAGSALVAAGRHCGLRVANEVFADRGYCAEGTLVPRTQAGALITETAQAVRQVRMMVQEGKVRTVDGARIPIAADTVCLHGDGIHAVEFARELRAALLDAGFTIAACGR